MLTDAGLLLLATLIMLFGLAGFKHLYGILFVALSIWTYWTVLTGS